MKIKLSFTLFLLFALAICFSASSKAQPGSIPPGEGTSTAIHPDSIQDGNMYGYYMDMDAAGVAGGALIGKVQIAGDPLIWDPTPIHVTCAGKVAYTTFAGSKGNFVIRAVNSNGALSTEGDAKRQMETHFEGCSVSADLTGFTSTSITLQNRNFRDTPNIGIITLKRAENAKGTAVSSSTEDVSPKAVKLFEKARSDWEAQSQDHVEGELQEAVAIDPKFAEAWYELGRQEQVAKPDQAREDYARALAVDPQFILPYEQIMVLDSAEGKWKNALSDGAHALALDPRGTPQVWYAYAEGILKAYAAGALPATKLKVAEISAHNSLALDPQHNLPAEQLLALILAQEKNYEAAIDHLRNCLTYLPKGSSMDQVKQQIAQLEQMKAGATN
jgi:tetratricopeptide (TPR) repeat protein